MEGKGWAHSIAHAADAVEELSKRKLAQDDLIALLEAIRGAVCIKDRVYTNMEDDRLTTAVIMILEHEELDPVLISNWLNSFTLGRSQSNRIRSIRSSPTSKTSLRRSTSGCPQKDLFPN